MGKNGSGEEYGVVVSGDARAGKQLLCDDNCRGYCLVVRGSEMLMKKW